MSAFTLGFVGGVAVCMIIALLGGCGGRTSVDAPLLYPEGKSYCTHVNTSPPGDVYLLALSCEPGQRVVSGFCTVDLGGRVTESATTGEGWGCAAVAWRDQLRFCVNVLCTESGAP